MSSTLPPVENGIHHLPHWRLGKVELHQAVRDVADGCVKDDVMGLAAELTYHAALTLFPFLLVVAALPSVSGTILSVPDAGDSISRELSKYMSDSSAELVRNLIKEVSKTSGWQPFLLGLMGSLWSGTSTTSCMRKSLNRVYRFDDKTPFLARKFKEFWLTAAVGLITLGAVLVVLIGPKALGDVPFFSTLVADLIAVVLVISAVGLLFWQAPAESHGFQWITPGAGLFAVSWLVFSVGMAAYLSRAGNVNHVYGSLGAIIVLLIWLYGSNMAILVAAELNAAVGRREDPEVQAKALPK